MSRRTTEQVKITPDQHAELKAENREGEYLGETLSRGMAALRAIRKSPFEVSDNDRLRYAAKEDLDYNVNGEELAQLIQEDTEVADAN